MGQTKEEPEEATSTAQSVQVRVPAQQKDKVEKKKERKKKRRKGKRRERAFVTFIFPILY